MTGETRNESASGEATSIAPKLSGNPHPTVKVKPITMSAPSLTQRPVPLYPSRLSAELLTNINQKWESCWPVNVLRPLALLDLLSYLLFVKELKEKQLLTRKLAGTFGDIHTKEKDDLSWSYFENMDAQSMHDLFTKEKGLPELIKNYGDTGLRYSLFVKEPLYLTPTAAMLGNIVNIIKIMEAEDVPTRAAIFEYLINKAEITAQNGQVYAPQYVIRLMVALMQPSPEDLIGDPSAGNGSLLVNSAMYIANKNSAAIPNFKNDLSNNMYKGIESDFVQIRIGAMNMILHGIEDPKLESLNVFSKTNLNIREQPTLILSNLFFESAEDKLSTTGNAKPEARRQEIRFLNFILKSLKSGGRSAVIVRDVILYDIITEIKTIRQQIIDENKLEAVISLPVKAGSLFSGANILIFTKQGTSTTEKVWFYKMETGKREINKEGRDKINSGKNDIPSSVEESADITDIIARWKNEKEENGRKRTDKSFYVPVDEIRTNNYNLNFNEYRKIVNEPEPYIYKKISFPDKKSIPDNMSQEKGLSFMKRIPLPAKSILAIKKPPFITLLLSIICIAVAAYFIYSKNNRNNNNSTAVTTNNTASPATINPAQLTNEPAKSTAAKEKLSAKQIKAILKDTTGILHFPKQATAASVNSQDLMKAPAKNFSASVLIDKKSGGVASEDALKVQYLVVDTTYFHDNPDGSTHRKSFLDPLNKNILYPVRDENGFIFIVYTNRFGRTSKGWIDKKDLRPLR